MTRLLQSLLVDQVRRRGDATAIVYKDESLTYGQLDDASSRLASVLAQRGVRRGSRVCLLLPKTPQALVSILGVLKAGGTYVPLDPDSPAPRVEKMLRSCDDRFLLTSSASLAMATELVRETPASGEWCVGWLDDEQPDDAGSPDAFALDEIAAAEPLAGEQGLDPEDVAYIMFTSGSTGVPKGVMITHANVLAFVDWAVEYFGMGPDDRNSSHPPLHFDLSVMDIFASLAAGAELHLVPKQLNLLAATLVRFMRDSELTQWFSVPSVLNYITNADAVEQNDLPQLKRLIWCGEVLPTPTLRYFMERLPHVEFTNLYGPTEATIASSYYTLPGAPPDDRDDIPIGEPCTGEDLLILGDRLAPVTAGETGDLYLAGIGLSPGYWRDPEKTAAAFLTAEIDGKEQRIYKTGDLAWLDDEGLVHFVGRADTQIKSRGYRIELGEIETALHALDDLEDSAVVAIRSDGFEGWTICCAYVPASPGQSSPAQITSTLRDAVPNYMIPQEWREYQRLPTNPNGKVDRPRLKADFERQLKAAG